MRASLKRHKQNLAPFSADAPSLEEVVRLSEIAPEMRSFVKDEALAMILTHAHEVATKYGGPAIEAHCARLLEQRRSIIDRLSTPVPL
ncbi:hypothetical protein [Microvirga terricola]|uniref:Uncharacterized protein n=1 Tax=Microvirga terricola TaxID=2719797 RepID=A0ABX0V8N4_9HYPH|nr:hypothetical protein [Microvirga terricola]NIX75410.1 hypothetical protein [Microvirga terricola]